VFERVGLAILAALGWIGELSLFGARALRDMVLPPYEVREVTRHVCEIGWRSVPLIATSGFAIGNGCAWHPFWKRIPLGSSAGGSVNEQSRVIVGAVAGALCGAAVSYLFFTQHGRIMRDRLEPAIDDLRREFGRFQKTLEKMGDLANDSMRVVEEFKAARMQYPTGTTSH